MFGGKLTSSYIFGNILSIGYEIETGSLIKLSRITNEDGEQVLMNTDTAREDIGILETGEIPVEKAEVYNIEFYNIRSQEKYSLTSDENPFIPDTEDVKFYITNDIASSAFVKHLEKTCYIEEGDHKNDIYEYVTEDGEKYDINFEFWSEDSYLDCSNFSDVEWICTYYKPPTSSNIILNTLLNLLEIIIYHLDNLTPIKGNLWFKNKEGPVVEVDMNENSYLLHMPDTDLYYLKTTKGPSVNNIGTIIQMTLSCYVQNIFVIMLELLKHTSYEYESFRTHCESQTYYINKVLRCTDVLFDHYDKLEVRHKFKKRNKLLIQIKSYVSLILYKLYIYYNLFLGSSTKYFKNKSSFNLRHNNYDCYIELKRCIKEYFSVSEAIAKKIIDHLFLQPDILKEQLLNEPENTHLQRNVFDMKNKLEKTNENYGDPSYSLKSYFTFFEDPLLLSSNKSSRSRSVRSAKSARSEMSEIEDVSPQIVYHDWLEYSSVDAYSNKMKIRDDIVLVEYRAFPKILDNYIHSVLTPEERKLKTSKEIGALNIGLLKKFVEKERSSTSAKGKTKRNKRKNKRSRKK